MVSVIKVGCIILGICGVLLSLITGACYAGLCGGDDATTCSHKGMCSNNNQVVTEGNIYLGTKSKEECMAECSRYAWDAYGCEYHYQDQQCTMHLSSLVDSGNGDEGYICQLLSGSCSASTNSPAEIQSNEPVASDVYGPPEWFGTEPPCVSGRRHIDCQTYGHGSDYNGTISRTRTGEECQHWKSQDPHPHGFSRHVGSHNHCRNIFVEGRGPVSTKGVWCFTTNYRVRWDYCLVPRCCYNSIDTTD